MLNQLSLAKRAKENECNFLMAGKRFLDGARPGQDVSTVELRAKIVHSGLRGKC